MRISKLLVFILFAQVNFIFCFTEGATGWTYQQTPLQCFYLFIQMEVLDSDGNALDAIGDGAPGNECGLCCENPGSCDVVGAFLTHQLDNDDNPIQLSTCNEIGGSYLYNEETQEFECEVCVGWVYFDSGYGDETPGDILATTLPVMGADSMSGDETSEYYCQSGDHISLKFYDGSEDIYYDVTNSGTTDFLDAWQNMQIYQYENDIDMLLDNDDSVELPNSFDIISIYPNPFNPSTQISYTLNTVDYVHIRIFDSLGREVETLFNNLQEAGDHHLTWSPGSELSSGNYFIKIGTTDDLIVKKITYIK